MQSKCDGAVPLFKPRSILGHGLFFLLISSLITGIAVGQSSPEAARAAAEKLLNEGIKLREESSKESRQEAIRKFAEAQAIFHSLNDSSREAYSLLSIGSIYSDQGEQEKALDLYARALSLFRAIGDRPDEADTLNNIAKSYFELGQRPKALEYLTQALPLFRAIGDRSGEGNALLGIGLIYSDSDEKQKALEYYEQALQLLRAAGDRQGEANALNNIGLFYANGNDIRKSLDYYSQALAIHRAVEDHEGEANTLNNIATVYARLGEQQKALDYYAQVLPFFRAAGDRGGEARALISMGSIYLDSGEKQKALDSYAQALSLVRAIGDRESEANTLAGIGAVNASLYKNQTAIEYFSQALFIFRAGGYRRGEATTLLSLGSSYADQGDQQKALESYSEALSITRVIDDNEGEDKVLNNMGTVYQDLGDKQKALDFLTQALSHTRNRGERAGEAKTLNNIGAAYSYFGEKQNALDYYRQALPLFRTIGDRSGEANTLNNIGKVYFVLGERQKALDFYAQALSLLTAIDNRKGQAATLGNIGEAYSHLGDKPKAREYVQRALLLNRNIGDQGGEANMLIGMGANLDDSKQALDNYVKALSLFRAVNNREGEANALYYIGSAYGRLGENQKALEFSRQALALFRENHLDAGTADTLGVISQIEQSDGNLTEAGATIEEAIGIIESLRTKIASQNLKASYFATMQDYYSAYVDILMRLHQRDATRSYDREALQTSERARARTLLETLSEANAEINQGVDPKLLERKRSVRERLNGTAQAQMKLLSHEHSEAQAAAIAREIEALTMELEQVETQIRQTSPRYAALTQPRPLSLKEIQTQVLDDNTVLLEYSLGNERSYVWVVAPNSITSYELPKRDQIEAAARRFYELLTARNKTIKNETRDERARRVAAADREVPAAAAELSQMVLSPVLSGLSNMRLVIVADGALQYVPFAALPVVNATSVTPATSRLPKVNYQPLIAEHEIVNLPSASTLAVLRRETNGRPRARRTVVALADPVFTKTDRRVSASVPPAKSVVTEKPGATDEIKPENVKELQLLEAVQNTGVTVDGVNVPRLAGTRKEAEEIIALAAAPESKLYLDFAANREAATSPELSQYRFVHFSTHGFLNSVHPELSGIVLSLVNERGEAQDGFLRAHEIFNLKLSADLVVLSACQTGIGKEVKGEGLVSLTRGFMYAGAPRVVASLWSVSETGTTELMVGFYREMLKEGKPPAAALRAAQLSLMKEKQWSSPFFWAPFVLQGDWR